MKFLGEIGSFEELPKGNEMTERDYVDIQNIQKSYQQLEQTI